MKILRNLLAVSLIYVSTIVSASGFDSSQSAADKEKSVKENEIQNKKEKVTPANSKVTPASPSTSTFRSLQRGQRVLEYKYSLYA